MIVNPNGGNSPRVEVATPSISVSSGGLITAKTEQEKGYVPGGTKSSTKQLPTQAAKTVTPTTTNQTAVASGRYTTGDVVVAGDANLTAENIAEGVSIFGVTGTFEGASSDVVVGTLHYAGGISSSMSIAYFDGQQPISADLSGNQTIYVAKGSLLAFYGGNFQSITGDVIAAQNNPSSTILGGIMSYLVNGDFTINY